MIFLEARSLADFMASEPSLFAVVLTPTDKESEAALARAEGKTLAVEAKRARSPEQNRCYFSILSFVFENQEQFKSADDLREATLIEIGHSELRELMDGSRYRVAKSISFHNLGHEKFQDVFDRSIDLWCAHFGHDPQVLLGQA